MEPDVIADAVSRRAAPVAPKRRSRLALSSGILGIIALVMLFAIPITYLFVATIGDSFDSVVVPYSLLGIHILTVAVGGLVALVMGIAGLVSLGRRKGRLVGHGWAITGLCTAPLPTIVGGLIVLSICLSLVAVRAVSVETSGSPTKVVSSSSYYPGQAASCGPNLETPYGSVPTMPSSLSLPVGSTPSFCAPDASCPPSIPPTSRKLLTAGFETPAELQPAPAPLLRPLAVPSEPPPPIAPAGSKAAPAPSSAAPPPLR